MHIGMCLTVCIIYICTAARHVLVHFVYVMLENTHVFFFLQIFFYINSNCVSSKTIWRKKSCRIEFSIDVQNGNVQLFCNIKLNCVLFKIILKNAVAQWRLTDWQTDWRDWRDWPDKKMTLKIPGNIYNKSGKLKLRIFQDNSVSKSA